MSDAHHAVEVARTERLALLLNEFGAENAHAHLYGMRARNPGRNTRARAALLRAQSDELRGLPMTDAAELIETNRVERERAQQQTEQRRRKLSSPEPSTRQSPGSQHERGIGS